jgi:hypothetical protein
MDAMISPRLQCTAGRGMAPICQIDAPIEDRDNPMLATHKPAKRVNIFTAKLHATP